VTEQVWYPTDIEGVFHEIEDFAKDDGWKGELRIAKLVRKTFPNYVVKVTIGPYRFCDVSYKLSRSRKEIFLDFYSVRLPSAKDVKEMIFEMKRCIENADIQTKTR